MDKGRGRIYEKDKEKRIGFQKLEIGGKTEKMTWAKKREKEKDENAHLRRKLEETDLASGSASIQKYLFHVPSYL